MKKLSTLIILSLFFITNGFSSHLAGGNISYTHLGNQKYNVEVRIIRDCGGNLISNTPISVKCNKGSFNSTLPLVSKNDVTGIGKQCITQSGCAGNYQYGFEEFIFRGVIDLNSLNCCEVTFSWHQAGRVQRSSVSNSSAGLYLEAVVNKCAGASLVWNTIPTKKLFHLNKEETVNYSISGVNDNDSVSYELISPMSYQGVPLTYKGNFRYNKPITFLGFPNTNLNFPLGFHFDETNGNLKFRAIVANESSQIAIKASAWRRVNGVMTKVGTIITDQPIIMISQSTSSNPTLKANDVFNICLGDTSVALIEIRDFYSKTSYSVNLSHTLKWAEAELVTTKASKFVVLRFLADTIKTINKTNALTVEIKDDRCPIPGSSIKSYGINADSSLTKFTDSSSISKRATCNRTIFYHQNKSSNPDIEYYWSVAQNNDNRISVGDSAIFTAKDTGWVRAALIAYSKKHCNAFLYRDSVYINNNNLVRVSATGGETCNSIPFSVTATASQGSGTYSYSWSTSQTGKTVALNVSKGDEIYKVTATDSKGCKNSDTLRVINYHPIVNIIGDSLTCKGGKVNLAADIKDTSSNPTYTWSGFSQQQTQLKDSITAPKTYTFTIADGICTNSKSIEVKISQPTATFSHPPSTCSGTPIQLTATPQGGRAPYQVFWDSYQKSGASISVTTTNAKLGTSPYVATFTDALGCKGIKTGSFEILPTPKVNITKPLPLCEDNTSYSLLSLANPQGGTWEGDGITSNIFNATQTGVGVSELKYSFTNSDGCSDSATTFIKVYAKPNIDFIGDSITIFKGSKVSFTNTTIADTTYRSWWNFGDEGKPGNTFFGLNGSYTYNDTGKYTVQLKVDNRICSTDSILKTDYITVKVQPKNPNISVSEINQNALKLYPNPAKNKLTIEADNELIEIALVDVLGKRYIVENFNKSTKAEINIAHLAAGIYILEAKDIEGNVYTNKVQISR